MVQMASTRLPSFRFCNRSSWRQRPAGHLRPLRCHGVGDEGNQMDIVDANLMVLRERMENLRQKEQRLPACGGRLDNGWSYLSSGGKLDPAGFEQKNFALISECVEVMAMVGGAVGLVIVGGSLGICLVSLIVCHFGI